MTTTHDHDTQRDIFFFSFGIWSSFAAHNDVNGVAFVDSGRSHNNFSKNMEFKHLLHSLKKLQVLAGVLYFDIIHYRI